jgi:diguanylate cyclase (GGDEF)-like protein
MNDKTKRGVEFLIWLTAIGYVVGYAAILYAPFSPDVRYFGQSSFYIITPLIVAALIWTAFAVAREVDRTAWLFLALGVTTLLVGEVGWLSYQSYTAMTIAGQPPSLDTVNLCAFVLLFCSLLAMSRLSRVFITSRLRFTIDALIFLLFGSLVTWMLGVRPELIASPGLDAIYGHVNEILPVIAFGSVITVLANMVNYHTEQWSAWEKLVAVGLILFSGENLAVSSIVSAGLFVPSYVPAIAADIVWVIGVLLFGLASMHYMINKPPVSVMPSESHITLERPKGREIVAYCVLIGCLPILIFLAQTHNQAAYDIQIFLAGLFVWTGLLISRIILIMTENTKLFSTSVVDPVTGAYNLRFFEERLKIELDRAKRTSESLSLAVIDIDNFREFNNMYGHALGDKVLVSAAKSMQDYSRRGDTVCRIGGDEFAVIMPNTGVLDGHRLCCRIKDNMIRAIDGVKLEPKLSCGVASYPYHARESEELYKCADDAMYWAKYHGKDQVTVFDFEKVHSFDGEERLRKAEEIAHRNTAQDLADAMDARDAATKGHAKNVAALAEVFASRLNLSKHKIDMIRVAALVHDIGKISMPDLAAKDTSDLTQAEVTRLQGHTTLCEEILNTTDLSAILPWVMAHHERWDGGGYPAGLEGNQIPYEARIIALCDAYENLTRAKRDGTTLSHPEITSELISERGRKFDPLLTDTFVSLLDLLNSMRMTGNTRRSTIPARQPVNTGTGFGNNDKNPAEPDSLDNEYADIYTVVRRKLNR